MIQRLAPVDIHPPFARYAHGLLLPRGAALIVCSGQLGIAQDGTVPPGVEDQAALCFANIAAVLREGGLGLEHVVRLNAYVTGREHLGGYMRARDRAMTGPPVASTLMIVSGFARPEFLVEVEAIAASAV